VKVQTSFLHGLAFIFQFGTPEPKVTISIWRSIHQHMTPRPMLFFILASALPSGDAAEGSGGAGSGQARLKPHPDAQPNIHAPGVVDRPELVPFIIADPATLPGIVVDETEAKLEGAWQYSTHTPPYVGIGYLHDQRDGKGVKSATLTPNLPVDGWYEVRLAHCYNVRRATNTPVTVRHADGETVVRVNQQEEPQHARLWRTLGIFRFIAGRSGHVRIGNEGTDGKYVIVDAVQFLPAPASQARR
jgi:hypothetical protein